MCAPEHFDAVVVGSGFGGSVMAYRLAEAGLRVCVLERGKAYPPGSFARTPRQMRSNIWDPSRGYYGLFNIWSFKKIDAVVSSGLGGGSLIYANVLLRKPEEWFVRENGNDPAHSGPVEYWPITRNDLEPHYDAVERMLSPQRFPVAFAPYSTIPKVRAFQAAAQRISDREDEVRWETMPLGITFRNPGQPPRPGVPIQHAEPSLHGLPRYTCSMCGECDIGCNHGSKNTLDHTYLSAAKRCGADLRTLCEVRSFVPLAHGFEIHYVQHTPDEQAEGEQMHTYQPTNRPPQTITADRLILAAGTLGSTFLLMRCRDRFPAQFSRLSPTLGSRFCGNGDLITFAQSCYDRTNGKATPRLIDSSIGPVITSALIVPDTENGGQGRGFYIQDAGCPTFAPWLMQMVGFPRNLVRARDMLWRLLKFKLSGKSPGNISSDVMDLLMGDAASSASMFPMLGIGRDVPEGQLRLRYGRRADGQTKDLLDVEWMPKYSGGYFNKMRRYMNMLGREMGAKRLFDPLKTFRRGITVHPLGGCPMGETSEQGVVDAYGEVHNYPGLYVVDGSIMPGPVGVNPAFTIAAMADRCAQHIIDTRQPKWSALYELNQAA